MASAGSHLHALRERHGVSLEDLARVTRISQRFLEALEADEFAALPAGPFAKGFIRSYCQALNEPPEEPLALHAAATARLTPRRPLPPPPSRRKRSLAPLLVSLVLLVILGAALAAVTIALRSGRGDAPPSLADIPTGEGRKEEVAGPASRGSTVGAAPEGSARAAGAEGRVASPKAVTAPYRLVARATDATWVRVRTDGGQTTEETIPAGETREWTSNRPFELRIGNAGGLSLELNGKALPPLGPRGAVIMHVVIPAEAP